MRIVAFLVLIFCTNSWAKYLIGEGEFLTIESDKPSFVKKQLIFSAKKHILNNYLVSLDLSPQEFWQGFDSKIDERLKNKISWFDEKIDEMQSSDNFDELLNYQVKKRSMILKEKAKYLERSRVFSSYSIKSRSQSVSNPSLKFIKLKVKINKNRLKSLFFSLTKEELNKIYEKLNVNIEFKNLNGPDQENDKVTYQGEFMEELKVALIKKWSTFFEKNYSDVVKNVVFSTAEEIEELDNRLLVSPKYSSNNQEELKGQISENEIAPDLSKDESTEFSESLNETKVSAVMSSDSETEKVEGTLYLKLTFYFSKSYYSLEEQKGSYEFKAGLVMHDLSGGEVIFFDDFKSKQGDLFSSSANSFYSALATKLYNTPLKGLRKNKQKLFRYPSVNNNISVKVNALENINNLFVLKDFLSISGATHNFNMTDFTVLKDAIYFNLNFNGRDEEALDKFRQWESKKIGGNLVMNSAVNDKNIEIIISKDSAQLSNGEVNGDQKNTEI